MPFPRRDPIRISLELLGNESQFNNWVKDFLMRDKFIEEIYEARHYFYRKTESGDLFHRLLKNGEIIDALLRVGGKRLRS